MPLLRTETGKELEGAYIDTMVDLLELHLRSPPLACEPPAADFALELGDGRRIAVEVTEVTDGAAQDAWNGTQERLKTLTCDLLKKRSVSAKILLTTEVELLFVLRTRREISRAASRLADVVCEHLPRGLPSRNASTILGLGFLRVIKIDAAARTEIVFAGRGMPPRDSDHLQVAMDRKNNRISSYRHVPADAYWLLIVGAQGLSGHISVSEARSRRFRSAFDRTLFLDDSERTMVDLETVTPPLDLDT